MTVLEVQIWLPCVLQHSRALQQVWSGLQHDLLFCCPHTRAGSQQLWLCKGQETRVDSQQIGGAKVCLGKA